MASDGTIPLREEETRTYLQDHKILELFNNMTSQLIFHRPADPKKFMIETMERLQKSQATKRDYPCLFDDSNIQSVYGMLDPTNRGYITLQQYNEALETFGIQNFNEKPEGAADDRITFETFMLEAIYQDLTTKDDILLVYGFVDVLTNEKSLQNDTD